MLSANSVIEVGFTEYRTQFLWALNWSVEKMDEALDERPKEHDSEGFAIVADAVSAFAEGLEASPEQLLQVFSSKLSDTIDADPEATVLTKYAVRDLIADLVDQAHDDAFLSAVHKGRSVLSTLAADELASAADAIAVLEGLLRWSTEVPKPLAMRHGTRLAARWFNEQETESSGHHLPRTVSQAVETPAAVIEGLVEAGINMGSAANSAPSGKSDLKLVAEFPASFCPPIGKPLAYGSVGIVEDAIGRRVAVFKAADRSSSDLPMGGLLDFPMNAKAKMGGRIDLLGNYYIVVGGGKSAAKALLSELGV